MKQYSTFDNLSTLFTYLGGKLRGKPTAVRLTKAQYDALTESEKLDTTKVYYITDYDPYDPNPNLAYIDDTSISANSVWSSSKTSSALSSWGAYRSSDNAETDIQDADYVPFYDTSASGARKSLWSNVKAKLKAYFDTLYAAKTHNHTKSQITDFPTLATVATSGSYSDLSNKPTIPTVNNATLTIQKNGTTVKTFTANASSNVTANITVPAYAMDTIDVNLSSSLSLTTDTKELYNVAFTTAIPDNFYPILIYGGRYSTSTQRSAGIITKLYDDRKHIDAIVQVSANCTALSFLVVGLRTT